MWGHGEFKLGDNSLLASRIEDAPNFELDFSVIIQEFASFVLLAKGGNPKVLKEQIPAFYHAVVKTHPDYAATYAAYCSSRGPGFIPGKALAKDVTDPALQAQMKALAFALVQAQEQYIASVNVVQQGASSALSANVRPVRSAGKKLKACLQESTPIYDALAQHEQYLKALAQTEKLVQTCIDRISEQKNGDEDYSKACTILTNALKKSMRQNQAAQATKRKKRNRNEKQRSFLESVRSKLLGKSITENIIISFLPDVYDAISPNISDRQMEAIVLLAEHYIRLNDAHTEAQTVFDKLSFKARQSLAKAGIVLRSPYDHAMAVAYDPMQMANYFYDQYGPYLEPLSAVKEAVVNAGYGFLGMVADSFYNVGGYFFGAGESYFTKISRPLFPSQPLTENAYINAMAFLAFLQGLGGVFKRGSREALFKHYFELNKQEGSDVLTFEAYLANEKNLVEIVNHPKQRPQNELFAMARVAQLQSSLSGMRALEDLQGVIGELEHYHHQFKDTLFFKEYLAQKFHLLVPVIYESLLVPVIFRLVDEGKITKDDERYHYLGEILKAVQKKQLITMDVVGAVLALVSEKLSEKEVDPIRGMIERMRPWVLGAAPVVVHQPKPSEPVLAESIRTDQRNTQDNIQNVLEALQPSALLNAVIAHLDHHIKQCERLQLVVPALCEMHLAKLRYCEAVKASLQGVLNNPAFQSNKKLAAALIKVKLPAIATPGKRQMAKLLFRVADEFGPVTAGSEDPTPLVEKIMNFVLETMDNDGLTWAYEQLTEAYNNRNGLALGNDHDDLSVVWFDDETNDPFDIATQGGQMAHSVITHYFDALVARIGENPTVQLGIDYLNMIPGFGFVVSQLSAFADKIDSKEALVSSICRFMGLQTKAVLHEQPYVVRLSHLFFKRLAVQGVGLREFVLSTGLVADSEVEKMCQDIEALNGWSQGCAFKPSSDLSGLTNGMLEGESQLREYKIQVLLTHCENLRKYAMRFSDQSRRRAILSSLLDALRVFERKEIEALLTSSQAETLAQLRKASKAEIQTAEDRESKAAESDLKILRAEVTQTHGLQASRVNRKRTILNIVFSVGYYIADLLSMAFTVYSLVAPVLQCVASIKALSVISFQAVSLAIGSTFVGAPLAIALLVGRFVVSAAWEAYQCRQDFRKDWKACETKLAKAGVIAKYVLVVAGKAFLATFLSAAMVDTAVGLIKKVRGLDVPFVKLIRDKINARPKLNELEKVKGAFKELKTIKMADDVFAEKVAALKDRIAELKYHPAEKKRWAEALKAIEEKRNRVVESTHRLVQQALEANQAKPEPESVLEPLQGPSWDEFVRAKKHHQVIPFSQDVMVGQSMGVSVVGFRSSNRPSVLGSSIFPSVILSEPVSVGTVVESEPKLVGKV